MWFMTNIAITVNEESYRIDVAPDTPLLWVLLDTLGLTGTKYGCGMGLCGASAVHLDGSAVRACQTSVKNVGTKKVTTIEGLGLNGIHPVQQAWINEQVPQCGYCQSGQIMQAAAFLAQNPHPSLNAINGAMAGNICRCATYQRIRRSIQRAAEARS
jgi:aerobic-type carbon monoxide dehydrogenase small subunit (CoxS/CutS family)